MYGAEQEDVQGNVAYFHSGFSFSYIGLAKVMQGPQTSSVQPYCLGRALDDFLRALQRCLLFWVQSINTLSAGCHSNGTCRRAWPCYRCAQQCRVCFLTQPFCDSTDLLMRKVSFLVDDNGPTSFTRLCLCRGSHKLLAVHGAACPRSKRTYVVSHFFKRTFFHLQIFNVALVVTSALSLVACSSYFASIHYRGIRDMPVNLMLIMLLCDGI